MNPNDQEKIETLRTILLKNDRAVLHKIEDLLNHPDQLSAKVRPIIERELEVYQEKFPATYRLAVENIIERKLKASQDELLDVMYPILGKMIRKYIAQQLQSLKENIEKQLHQSFIGRLKARFFGVSDSELIMHQAIASRVEEAYVIQQYSGLLLGSASNQETIDKDLIGGMLTAIKSFVQDAYQQSDIGLEMIDYGSYQILIQDLYTYYIALAINGSVTAQERENLSQLMLTFADKELNRKIAPDDPGFHLHVKQKLHQYFIKPHI